MEQALVRGYKINGPKGKKFYHRDDLRLTSKGDTKTTEMIAARKKEMEEREQKELDEMRVREDIAKEKRDLKNKRVPRKAGLAGLKSLRALTDREKKRDKTIGS